MAVSVEQFIKQIKASGVIPAEALSDFIPPKSSPVDAEQLAKELIRKKAPDQVSGGRDLEGAWAIPGAGKLRPAGENWRRRDGSGV